MKRSTVLCPGVIALSFVVSASAQAAIVNYSAAYDLYPGIIPIGQTGSIQFSGTEIDSGTQQQNGINGIFGELAPYSILTFSFNYSATGLERVDNAIYGNSGLHTSLAGIPTTSFDVVSIGTNLVTARSGISSNALTAWGKLTNDTGVALPFSQWIQESLNQPFVTPGTITYSATALPLPASLPMYVITMFALFAAVQFKSQRRQA